MGLCAAYDPADCNASGVPDARGLRGRQDAGQQRHHLLDLVLSALRRSRRRPSSIRRKAPRRTSGPSRPAPSAGPRSSTRKTFAASTSGSAMSTAAWPRSSGNNYLSAPASAAGGTPFRGIDLPLRLFLRMGGRRLSKEVVMSRTARLALTAVFAGLLAVGVLATADGAKADPYRWCAQYGNSDDNGTNCLLHDIGAVPGRDLGQRRLLHAEQSLQRRPGDHRRRTRSRRNPSKRPLSPKESTHAPSCSQRLAMLIASSLTGEAKADPYRWCAEYGGGRGGGTNCYFMTSEQCRAAISGNGGFCRHNHLLYGRRSAAAPECALATTDRRRQPGGPEHAGLQPAKLHIVASTLCWNRPAQGRGKRM